MNQDQNIPPGSSSFSAHFWELYLIGMKIAAGWYNHKLGNARTAPRELVGTGLTIVNSIGFTITIVSL